MGNEEVIYIVPLHEKPNLMQKCIKLLNDEWPRSETARMKSIENSNPNLPISLLLVRTSKESQDEVIGHAKMNRLRHDPGSCWIESVIINPTNRGKGYGKLLMDACEKLAKQLGFSTAVLSTHDKQEFYRKLGYEICDPVSHYGAGLTANKPGLLTYQGTKNKTASAASSVTVGPAIRHLETAKTGTTTSILQIPPPPPPLPKHTNVPHSNKVYMSKSLLVPKSI